MSKRTQYLNAQIQRLKLLCDALEYYTRLEFSNFPREFRDKLRKTYFANSQSILNLNSYLNDVRKDCTYTDPGVFNSIDAEIDNFEDAIINILREINTAQNTPEITTPRVPLLTDENIIIAFFLIFFAIISAIAIALITTLLLAIFPPLGGLILAFSITGSAILIAGSYLAITAISNSSENASIKQLKTTSDNAVENLNNITAPCMTNLRQLRDQAKAHDAEERIDAVESENLKVLLDDEIAACKKLRVISNKI